jgi:hypothetical protein
MLEDGMAALSLSGIIKPVFNRGPVAASLRFILISFLLTVVLWLCGLAALLAMAQRVHVDVPQAMALKLPLLKYQPGLIIAGESRNLYGFDPVLSSELLGERRGYAVNIAYEAGEPLSVLGAAKLKPDAFRNAHVVLSVAPFNFNDGTRQAYSYPLNVAARESVGRLMWDFLPLRIGTLIRFIREAFASRLALSRNVYDTAPEPRNFGFTPIAGQKPLSRWIPRVGAHQHYQGFDLSGSRTAATLAGLCELAPKVRKLTVVIPPWAAKYPRAEDSAWNSYETQIAALIRRTAARCSFDMIDAQSVPGLGLSQFYDEMHVNPEGVPIYTAFIVNHLRK